MASLLISCLLAVSGLAAPEDATAVSGDPNAYFNALVARGEHFKSYSLRSQAEINRYSSRGVNTSVTYDPTVDAAKVVIPSFGRDYRLAAPVSPTDDRIVLAYLNTDIFTSNRGIKINGEIMKVSDPPGSGTAFPAANTVTVARGLYGTTAASHGVGTLVQVSVNGLDNQVRVPIGTSDGHKYFITWDVLYTESFLSTSLSSHKTYQLADKQSSAIWLETRTAYNGQDGIGRYPGFDRNRHVAVISVRSYNTRMAGSPGSNITDEEPLKPQAGRFLVWPNRWVRFFWLIEQRAGAHDLATLWVADAVTDPVKIIDARTVSVRGTPPTILEWYLEFSASQDPYRSKLAPLVSYARNLVILEDVPNPLDLLRRPSGDEPLPSPSSPPSAPTGVRIMR